MAFWGVEVKPGKPFTLDKGKTCGRLRISQATLGFGSANTRSLVQCNMGKKTPVLLCCLLPGVLECCHLELEFEESEKVIFSVIGARSVHLTGYYLPLTRSYGGIEESESFGEDIGDTDTEKSDGGNDEDEDEYEDSFIDDGEPEVIPSSPSSHEVRSKKKTKKKKDDTSKRSKRRLRKMYESSESEDDYVPSDDETPCNKIRGQVVISDDDDDQCPIAKDSSRTSNENQSERRKSKREKRKSDKEKEASAANNTDEDRSEDNRRVKKKRKSGEGNDTVVVTVDENDESEEKKGKKKKKRKNTKANGDVEIPQGLGETKTLSGGVVIEELDLGNPDGKVAATGNKVTIHYTGKLKEGGKVFDSSDGKHPLKFRLGKGLALDGLDIGIQGMRIGGKRRILIPPALGYGDEGSEKVPPKAWLIMDVELLKVR